MKSRTAVLLMGVLLVAVARVEAGPPAAVLMGMTGRCEVAPIGAEAFRPAGAGMALNAGDVLSVLDGTATVLRSDGRVETVEAGKRIKVEAVGRPRPKQGPMGRLWETLVNRAAQALSGRPIYSDPGAVRALARIDLVSPRNTALLAAPARVEWVPHASVKTYHVRLFDGNGSVVWSSTTTRGFADLDGRAAELRPGEYYFVRVADVRRGGLSSDQAYFRILTPAEQQSAREDVEAIRASFGPGAGRDVLAIAAGAIYERWELIDEALALYRTRGDPRNPAIADAMRVAYAKNGRRSAGAR